MFIQISDGDATQLEITLHIITPHDKGFSWSDIPTELPNRLKLDYSRNTKTKGENC